MIVGVLPVKSPADSMSRLSALLSPAEREELARCLALKALETLTAVSLLDRLIVVANDAGIIAAARHAGAHVLEEAVQLGHTQSAENGIAMAAGLGATTVLCAPIDVPLATADDYTRLLEAASRLPSPALVIVPSADGSGTNALVRKPPEVIVGQFGPGSFQKHTSSARAAGAQVDVQRPLGITLDLDTPEDLLAIEAPAGTSNDVLDYLFSIDAFERARAAIATPQAARL
ncbi:MAG: 2-phospho-L-lactate guanylyltransferase [Acidobacteria bacterium]|nr:2-phospho-L-lactate guanylyltransferase [Acidobacteriota bacterium]